MLYLVFYDGHSVYRTADDGKASDYADLIGGTVRRVFSLGGQH